MPAPPERPDPERSGRDVAPSSAPTARERGDGIDHPDSDAPPSTLDTAGHSPINIRNLSVVCGRCHQYQTLARFERRGEWNVYTYECESGKCEPEATRTLIEVPAALDEFANRDPSWRGGRRHAGAE